MEGLFLPRKMHHNDEDAENKIPNLESVEKKYENTFKREIRECYENHSSKIHNFAYIISDSENDDPNHNELTYTDYDGAGDVAMIIGSRALHNIDDIKTKLKNNLDNPGYDQIQDIEIEMYLGKCALKNGEEA